jgi:hypothetical protein
MRVAIAGKSLRSFRANGLVQRQIGLPVVGASQTSKRPLAGVEGACIRACRIASAIATRERTQHEMPFFMCFAKVHAASPMQCRRQRSELRMRIGAAGAGRPGTEPEKKLPRIVDRPKNRD